MLWRYANVGAYNFHFPTVDFEGKMKQITDAPVSSSFTGFVVTLLYGQRPPLGLSHPNRIVKRKGQHESKEGNAALFNGEHLLSSRVLHVACVEN